MKVGRSIPRFIPLGELERQSSPYIDGNSMFIKMLFFRDSVSIDLLPSLMSVDPALPELIQNIWFLLSPVSLAKN